MVPDHIHDQKIVEDKRKISKDRRMDSIAVDAKGSQDLKAIVRAAEMQSTEPKLSYSKTAKVE